MAETQISFEYMNDADKKIFGGKEGAVIISKRNEEELYADLFADLEGKRWQIRPEYSWEEFIKESGEDFSNAFTEAVNKKIETALKTLMLRYFRIEKNILDETGELQLNIWALEGDETVVVGDDGEIVTVSELQEQITSGSENGTISVSGTDVSITGLRSAAYTESEDYTPMATSNWTDL